MLFFLLHKCVRLAGIFLFNVTCSSLEELSASGCQLTELQDIAEMLPQLQMLNVSSNQLESFNQLVCDLYVVIHL